MKSKIDKVLNDIFLKKKELRKEYIKLRKKYGFRIEGKKIIWNKKIEDNFKKYKKSISDTIFLVTFREILSIPFIWMMFLPTIILDFFLFIYQNTAIRLYKIPLTKRSDYVVFDRGQLAYLNWIQKINCIYCSYVNGIFQYAVEIGGRTEKYWCPIKHANKKKGEHDWEKYFADYGDVDSFKKKACSLDDFKKNLK